MDGHWWNWEEARWIPCEPGPEPTAEVPAQRGSEEPADDLHRTAESVALQRPVG